MKRIVLGLSDGVDSAAAGLMLKQQGWDVLGVYLDLGGPEQLEAAKRSAREIGIGFEVLSIRDELEKHVCAPFVEEYLRGRTPSPCPGCNRDVKLPALLRAADRLGIEQIATGHYVRKENGMLYMGAEDCDQSYMFALLTPQIVRRLELPLGHLSKKLVRVFAQEHALSCADKPDSRENCFIRGMGYADYIRLRASDRLPGPGPVIFRGQTADTHEGIYRYTVGQRWGRDIGERRAYVADLEADTNTITLGLWEDLFTGRVRLSGLSFLDGSVPTGQFDAAIRVRHTRWETPECRVTPCMDGTALVETQTDLRAPCPGQTAALYQGRRLIGGGIVEKT